MESREKSLEHKKPDFLNQVYSDTIFFNDAEKFRELKEFYKDRYPENIKEIEVVFGLREFLVKQKEVDKIREKRKHGERELSVHDQLRDLAEYQFLITDYIIQNKERNDLERFWRLGEEVASRFGSKAQFEAMKRGILGQCAVLNLLEKLGKKPHLSMPAEDVYNAIDLWVGEDEAAQVKSTMFVEKPILIKADRVSFPAIVTEGGQELHYYSEKMFHENAIFRAKIEKYGKRIGKKIKGYMFIIPYSEIDQVTGQSSSRLIEFFRNELVSSEEQG